MNIAEFVVSEARKPFRWGETDCVSTADRWVRNCTGLSPLAWIDRQYINEAEASAILSVRGGFPILVNRAMHSQGFEKTTSPVCGDVGLIIQNRKLCMAIHAETIWFSHDETGLIGAPLNAIWKAWRIQCQ